MNFTTLISSEIACNIFFFGGYFVALPFSTCMSLYTSYIGISYGELVHSKIGKTNNKRSNKNGCLVNQPSLNTYRVDVYFVVVIVIRCRFAGVVVPILFFYYLFSVVFNYNEMVRGAYKTKNTFKLMTF